MSTRKSLAKSYNKALSAINRVSASLQELGRIASDVYGEELVADFCDGDEIEFRRVLDDGMPDAYDTIRIDDLYNRLEE